LWISAFQARPRCRCCRHGHIAMGHVPVIDLSKPQEEAAKAVEHACSTSGFFMISNHGVPEDVIARAFEENKKFFALPEEEKAKIKVNKLNRCGWQQPQGQSD
jgi:isopenicillin N synthase-like dioxygenase